MYLAHAGHSHATETATHGLSAPIIFGIGLGIAALAMVVYLVYSSRKQQAIKAKPDDTK